VGTPGCGWSSPLRSSHACRPVPPSARPCVGRMSVVAPSPQSGITRAMPDRAVSRPPLIAWVTLGDGCRVRPVRGACASSCMCSRWAWRRPRCCCRCAGTHRRRPGPAGATGGYLGQQARRNHRCPPRSGPDHAARRPGQPRRRRQRRTLLRRPRAGPRPSVPGRSRQRCRRISRGRWPTSWVAKAPLRNSARLELRVSRSSPVPRCRCERPSRGNQRVQPAEELYRRPARTASVAPACRVTGQCQSALTGVPATGPCTDRNHGSKKHCSPLKAFFAI
jgi:hypothetical protein